MPADHRRVLVVGVDGSSPATTALDWALAEARLRGADVVVCQAAEAAFPREGLRRSRSLLRMGRQQPAPVELGLHALARAAAHAAEVAPEVHVSTVPLRDEPASGLIEVSNGADLLVVGSHGTGGMRRVLAGSVSMHVASRATCPVVVVRGEEPLRMRRPVVVGVDGSPPSGSAVGLAFVEAELRGVPVVAVHAWGGSPVRAGALTGLGDHSAARRRAAETLAAVLAPWEGRYPDVPVQHRAVPDTPPLALAAASREASLLVVGTYGRGAFAGMLLGSVSQAVLGTAHCPVAVARAAG